MAHARATTYIGLGSNVGDRAGHIRAARHALEALPATRLLAFSPVYETNPVGPIPQGRYLNAAAGLETALAPLDLLAHLTAIEQAAGRPPHPHRIPWGPRTLDLDLLLYDQRVITTAELSIPHPRMHERWFVLRPLADIAPHAVHPVLGQTIRDLLHRLPDAAATGAKPTEPPVLSPA
jgi:2-amino-4-hydroxy-6-hydroxymethyldihydropteridine diphosphokinase